MVMFKAMKLECGLTTCTIGYINLAHLSWNSASHFEHKICQICDLGCENYATAIVIGHYGK